jgi:hypothetical protein
MKTKTRQRQVQMVFLVPKELREEIRKDANKRGMTISAWARMAFRKELGKPA